MVGLNKPKNNCSRAFVEADVSISYILLRQKIQVESNTNKIVIGMPMPESQTNIYSQPQRPLVPLPPTTPKTIVTMNASDQLIATPMITLSNDQFKQLLVI